MALTKDFWLLGLRAGWHAAQTSGVRTDDSLRLQTLPGTPKPLTDADGTLGGLVLPAGIAVDDEDRVYVVDAGTGLIKRFDPCTAQFETLPCVGGLGDQPRQISDPHGLAISCAGDLYVADSGNRRVQIFALKGFALRAIWGPLRVVRDDDGIHVRSAKRPLLPPSADCPPTLGDYPAGTWQPYDVAITGDNRALVSDYANGLIHVFDRRGRWKAAWNGESPEGVALDQPTRLALDAAGRLYVLQTNQSYVVVLDSDGAYLGTVEQPQELEGRFCPVSIAIDADGNLCLGDQFSRRLYVYYAVERRSLALCTCAGSVAAPTCNALAFDLSGNPLVCDPSGKQIVCLPAKAAYVASGSLLSEPLDSLRYQCQWHQVRLQGTIPQGARLVVETLTSEALKTTVEVAALPASRWDRIVTRGAVDGAWDCLVQSAPGRYLWLRLTLESDGAATPEIEWIEVRYPRASSLRFLPAVYQEDAHQRPVPRPLPVDLRQRRGEHQRPDRRDRPPIRSRCGARWRPRRLPDVAGELARHDAGSPPLAGAAAQAAGAGVEALRLARHAAGLAPASRPVPRRRAAHS